MAEIKVGDLVRALRMHNKAVELTGTVETIDGTMATMRLVENPVWIETVHLDDVTLIEAKPGRTSNAAE
jgi:hypothetical protein